MELFITGLASSYEAEHVARLFFPGVSLVKRYPARGADMALVRGTKARFVCAVRIGGVCVVRTARYPACRGKKNDEYAVCRRLFLLLREVTGLQPAWGMLTGVRPVRLVRDLRQKGRSEAEIRDYFTAAHFVSEEKYKLSVEIDNNQQNVINSGTPRSYSLYIGIPFCPSRCSYCSFVSRTVGQSEKLIGPYIDALCAELADIAALAQRNRLRLETIYIGGGTPTALSPAQLRTLLACVQTLFDTGAVREYTVEAGRPDCTTPEKLALIKEYGATRVSINPQTL